MQSQRISNLETVVRQLKEKFLKATPHITVEDTEVEKFKGLMSSANKELNSLGLKLAFQAQIISCLSYCPAGIMVISMQSTRVKQFLYKNTTKLYRYRQL